MFYGDVYGDLYDGYYPWEWEYGGEEWDDNWNYGDDWYDGIDYGLSQSEQAAIDTLRASALPGFPDFLIEDVLLFIVDDGGLIWDCYEEEGVEYPRYYVSATGYLEGSFEMAYAGFIVENDGTVSLYHFDDGTRNEFEETAIELYKEWYDKILSNNTRSTAA